MSNVTKLNRWSLWTRKSRSVGSDEEGAAAIEFAIIGPTFFLAVIGLVEVSMMILVSVLLEAGVRESSRFGLTGRDGDGGLSREEQIVQTIQDTTFGLLTIEASQIETLIYQSFDEIGLPEDYIDDSPANGQYDSGESFTDANGNGQWDPDRGTPGSGGADEIVLYRVNADWAALTPLFSPFLGEDGLLNLQASVAIRNEPF